MNVDLSLPDALGLLGVALILASYALLQAGVLSQRNPAYSIANALGAGLILISLVFDFNLPAAVIEACWLLISLFGLWRWRHKKASDPNEAR